MMREKPVVQRYERYSSEDFRVWQALFTRQVNNLKSRASSTYLEALERIGFNEYEIPDFIKVNEKLIGMSGWKLMVVPELVPQREFFTLIAAKCFPATCWLRSMSELDYIEEPDMFHDVFGHVPLLGNPEYATFMENFGLISLKWVNNPAAIELLGRLYWFTVEFGLIREMESTKIFGAGIISSSGETHHALGNESARKNFDVVSVLTTSYRNDVLQPTYFEIRSFQDLLNALPEVERALDKLYG